MTRAIGPQTPHVMRMFYFHSLNFSFIRSFTFTLNIISSKFNLNKLKRDSKTTRPTELTAFRIDHAWWYAFFVLSCVRACVKPLLLYIPCQVDCLDYLEETISCCCWICWPARVRRVSIQRWKWLCRACTIQTTESMNQSVYRFKVTSGLIICSLTSLVIANRKQKKTYQPSARTRLP